MSNSREITLNVIGIYCFKTLPASSFSPERTTLRDVLDYLRRNDNDFNFEIQGDNLNFTYDFRQGRSKVPTFVARNPSQIASMRRSTTASIQRQGELQWDLEITGIFEREEIPFLITEGGLTGLELDVPIITYWPSRSYPQYAEAIRNRSFRILLRPIYKPFAREVPSGPADSGVSFLNSEQESQNFPSRLGVSFDGFPGLSSFYLDRFSTRQTIAETLDEIQRKYSQGSRRFRWEPVNGSRTRLKRIQIGERSIENIKDYRQTGSAIIWQFYRYRELDLGEKNFRPIRYYTPPKVAMLDCRVGEFIPVPTRPHLVKPRDRYELFSIFFRPLKINLDSAKLKLFFPDQEETD